MLVLLGRSLVVGGAAGSVVAGAEGNWEGCLRAASELKAVHCMGWVGMDWGSSPEVFELAKTAAVRVSLGVLRSSSACVEAGGGHLMVVGVAKESAAWRAQARDVLMRALECRLL